MSVGIQLSEYARRRIIHIKLNEPGMTRLQIQNNLRQQDNITASITSISYVWKKWCEHSTIADLPRAGRPPILEVQHLNYIDAQIDRDRELSAADLCALVFGNFGLRISPTTMRRVRYKMQWRRTGTKYCQMIRDVNKEKRLNFCLELTATNENFSDVIFTDECSVELQRSVGKTFRKLGEPKRMVPKPKHPLKVSFPPLLV